MDCEHCLEWMSEALDSPLSPERQAELDAHLAGCPSCRALYKELTRQSQALRTLDCTFPKGLHRDILDHLPVQEPACKRGTIIHLRRWVSLAACVALVVVLGVVQPWNFGGSNGAGAAPNAASVQDGGDAHVNAGVYVDPRAQASADTQIIYSQLPEGWEDIVDAASPEYAILSGGDALNFLALLEEQDIPYTVEGDETFSGSCQLIPAEE